jgi:SAM-dependent methyltransferase
VTAGSRRSLLYRSPALYDLAMRVLYGRHHAARLAAVADVVPQGASVLELCCGSGLLYRRHLKDRAARYTGLDYSPAFVAYVRRHGGDARRWDVRSALPLPAADVVVMQASLYQFLPDPRPVLDRMLAAARQRVIVAEPVRNLTSQHPRLRRLIGAATDAGTGTQEDRFDEAKLDALFVPYRDLVEEAFLIPGGREKAFVLRPSPSA